MSHLDKYTLTTIWGERLHVVWCQKMQHTEVTPIPGPLAMRPWPALFLLSLPGEPKILRDLAYTSHMCERTSPSIQVHPHPLQTITLAYSLDLGVYIPAKWNAFERTDAGKGSTQAPFIMATWDGAIWTGNLGILVIWNVVQKGKSMGFK